MALWDPHAYTVVKTRGLSREKDIESMILAHKTYKRIHLHMPGYLDVIGLNSAQSPDRHKAINSIQILIYHQQGS